MNRTRIVGIVIGAFALFLLGRWSNSWRSQSGLERPSAHEPTESVVGNKPAVALWTCPMHPEIQLPEPGACPKCGMDLVLMQAGDDAGPRQLRMSPNAVQLARVVTSPVVRRFLSMPIRMVGKVEYDETRVRTIAARVGGRLDRLYVDYTGIAVKKGDHLVWLYSPQLVEAQQELLEAKKRLLATSGEASDFLAESNRQGYRAAREKLLLWGLGEAQVAAIETRGTTEDHMMIQSPTEGVVIHKAVNQGDYVKEGTAIYRIADLSQLWILLDAFEQDLAWLRYGQSVSVQTEAIPGETFEGRISFIDPLVQESTRTVKVRVQITNKDMRLKPGMFVRAVVQSRVADGGRVMEPSLAGKWISPMHPEIVKDGPGTCDVCGMDLVPAESLGYGTLAETTKPLVVPTSAVLVTGTRAVVYVEVPGTKLPTYEGREVVLGPRAGDFYIVRAGLEEHERVVTQGAFRIDSSMQIQAKPSMMSMPGEANTFTGANTAALRLAMEPIYAAYLALQRALAGDDAELAKQAGTQLRDALHGINIGALSREARSRWEDEARILEKESAAVVEARSITELRRHFAEFSRSVLTLETTFKHKGATVRYEAHCPMAFDNTGASWLQTGRDILNPYFGKAMLSCGEIRTEFHGVDETTRPAKSRTPAPAKEPEASGVDDRRPAKLEEAVPGAARALDTRAAYAPYFAVQVALAADDLAAATAAIAQLAKAIRDPAVKPWKELSGSVAAAKQASSIDDLRAAFEAISKDLFALHEASGHVGKSPYYRLHCPMAFGGRGAEWMQEGKQVANPYFGASMLRCGSVTQELAGAEQR